MLTLQQHEAVILCRQSQKKKSNKEKGKQKARSQDSKVPMPTYSTVSTRLPMPPKPSTCFSNNCTFFLSSSSLCFSSIHHISHHLYRLPSACKLPIAVSSTQQRSSSCVSLLLEGDPLHDHKEACESCSSSDDKCEAWTALQRQIRCSACLSTRAGSCRSRLHAQQRNVAYLFWKEQRAT
jgi:hypothetical protein